MAEVLVEFERLLTADGHPYRARACGGEASDGLWQGWIEFVPVDGGSVLRSSRETTQPNRIDAVYWATGLTPVYLEGALERALNPTIVKVAPAPGPTAFDGPAPIAITGEDAPVAPAILNPFSVYEKGEGVLRRQLAALSPWHLVNIVKAYELTDEAAPVLNHVSAGALIDLIVSEVGLRSDATRIK
jgi:hypothetical protein